MHLVRWLHNRMAPGFLVNSLPKAGTNLLAKVCCLLPGVATRYDQLLHLDPDELTPRCSPAELSGPCVPLGVTWPRPVPTPVMRRALARVGRGRLVSVHAPWSASLSALLHERRMKTVLVVRDPRDVALSAARYIPRSPENVFHQLYTPLSETDRLTLTICGQTPSQAGQLWVRSIAESCESLAPWLTDPACLTVRFEDLVGPSGGGCSRRQEQTIAAIAAHLGLWATPAEVSRVAAQAFGGARTFHAGQTGSWRSAFGPAHVRLFKQVAGPQLVAWGYERDEAW